MDKITVSRIEIAAAVLMYPIAYIYTLIFSDNSRIWFGVFVLLFVLLVEYINRFKVATAESWIWLASIAVITLCVALNYGRVWDYALSIVFVHCFAVWWVLARSGKLLENRSGHFFPADVYNGFIRFPFTNFSLRLRCVRQGFRNLRGDRDSVKAPTVFFAILALCTGALLLYMVTASLAAADSGFNNIMAEILYIFTPKTSPQITDFIFRFLVSLPVGAWIFGLIARSLRVKREELDEQAEKINSSMEKMHIVPEKIWIFCAVAFILVYLLFFIVQGSYLFGAFSRSLPEGFTVAEYARQGFFELCRVMGINFILVWLITRTPKNMSKTLKILCSLLLAAGILFAVVAISKLGLYISCFGFTPKRLQSTWLALVLLCGCVCSIYSMWTGRRSFQFLSIFGAITLVMTHLV